MQIDFYLLQKTQPEARYPFVCRLIDKIYRQGKHRLYLHTTDKAEAEQLDELLWTFKDDSFIPHNLYGDNSEPHPPIQIGYQVTPTRHQDILINLTQEVPTFLSQFQRMIEIIPQQSNWRETARQRYKQYREAGHQLQSHEIAR